MKSRSVSQHLATTNPLQQPASWQIPWSATICDNNTLSRPTSRTVGHWDSQHEEMTSPWADQHLELTNHSADQHLEMTRDPQPTTSRDYKPLTEPTSWVVKTLSRSVTIDGRPLSWPTSRNDETLNRPTSGSDKPLAVPTSNNDKPLSQQISTNERPLSPPKFRALLSVDHSTWDDKYLSRLASWDKNLID